MVHPKRNDALCDDVDVEEDVEEDDEGDDEDAWTTCTSSSSPSVIIYRKTVVAFNLSRLWNGNDTKIGARAL